MLIVEDEWLIRMNTMEALEAAGFEVVEAENADEAIAILTARTDINLVLTDVHMPGSMDGLKLAHFVEIAGRPSRSLRPRVVPCPRRATFPTACALCKSPIRRGKSPRYCVN